jgi:cyclopropane fatty-acyl-phospholipid synthase-like methyltransferase
MTDLDERFDTVLDCGMFHLLRGEERLRFADSLRAVLPPGGRYFMMCFSDQQPGYGAAQRISRHEIIGTFCDGLRIDSIEPTRQEENRPPGSVPAWLVKITRTRARERT